MRNLEAITSLFLLWFYCSACCCLAHISSPGRWKSLWNNKTEHSQLIPSLSNRDNIIVIIRYSAGVHAVTAGWNTPGCFLRRHMEHYTDRQPQQAHYTHTHTHTHTLRYWKRLTPRGWTNMSAYTSSICLSLQRRLNVGLTSADSSPLTVVLMCSGPQINPLFLFNYLSD